MDILSILTAADTETIFTGDFLQSAISSLLGGGVVAGIFAVITKKSSSPESQNELARLGNDFASKLLEDARAERKELRDTIKELESTKSAQSASIEKLNGILSSKDEKIRELEDRQQTLAHKLRLGEKITLKDIFGKDAPSEITFTVDEDTITA